MTTENELSRTDPEFAHIVSRFMEEVRSHGDLDDRERSLAVLSALIGCGELDEFAPQLNAAARTPHPIIPLAFMFTPTFL